MGQTALTKYQYETKTGEILTLDQDVVEKYITGEKITKQEFAYFYQLCKTYKVNPFLKEAYLVKYGSSPATIVLDYKVYQQIAEENPHYQGMKTGLLVVDKNGNAIEREGGYVLPNEKLIAGWCEVYRDDKKCNRTYSMFDEFKVTSKKTGELNANWSGKPCFMIIKVAKAQALREAFPNAFGSNVYSIDEFDAKEQRNSDYVEVTPSQVKEKVAEKVATEDLDIDIYDDVKDGTDYFEQQLEEENETRNKDDTDKLDLGGMFGCAEK